MSEHAWVNYVGSGSWFSRNLVRAMNDKQTLGIDEEPIPLKARSERHRRATGKGMRVSLSPSSQEEGTRAEPNGTSPSSLSRKNEVGATEAMDEYQIVLLIHGIRTQADWGPMVKSKLEVPGQIEVIPIKYGYFDAFRFWLPFWTRKKPIERVYKQIRVALQVAHEKDPHAKLSIIAHSFGTYIIGQILKEGFDLHIHRLILCGSVLPQDFQWEQYQGRFDRQKVINECGKTDIWPVLAKALSWGYGPSGTHGFGAVLVKDRFHAGGHGQYFEPDFVEKSWEPFIRRGQFEGSKYEVEMPPTPWWISMMGILQLKWLFIAAFVLASIVCGSVAAHSRRSTQSSGSNDQDNSGWTRQPGSHAIDILTQQILANPNKGELYNLRGVEWRKKGEYDIAIDDFNAAIRLDPSNASAFINRGLTWHSKKEYDKAIADDNEAIRITPRFAGAFYNRGDAWSRKNEYVKAIADYTEAIRLDPKYPLAFCNRGTNWFYKKEFDTAIADFDAAIRLDPGNASAFFFRGGAWREKKDYGKAIADFNEAIRLNAKDAVAYANRGLCWFSTNEYDKAVADYDEVIRLDPSNDWAFYNRGFCWSYKSEHDKAIADYGEAIRLGPSNAWKFYYRALAWNNKKEYDKAIADYNEAIRLDPYNASEFYYRRGAALGNRKDYDKAIVDFNEAIRIDPKNAAAYANRGLAWKEKTEYDKAIADCDEAIRLDAKYAAAYINRGQAWNNKKEYDKAIADYNKAIRLDAKNAVAYINRGVAWIEKAEYEKAIADYNEAIRIDPKDAVPYANRALAWLNNKEYDRAIADYNEAIRIDAKFAPSFTGRAWLWATCPDPRFRDGKKAVESATRACELSEWKDANHIRTLAAVFAEISDFDKAVVWQEKANNLYTDAEDRKKGEERLKLYKDRKPHRETD
jgi:tetratricopeptide (TPR) repeat protein